MQLKFFLFTVLAAFYLSCVVNAQRPIGIHFDVEPASLPGGAVGNAPAYLSLLRQLKQVTNGRTILNADIPMGMGPTGSWGYQGRPLSEWVLDIVDVVTLMSYRDHAAPPDGIIDKARGFLSYARTVGKRVLTGVETACYDDIPDKVTYCEEGETVLERELNLAYDTLISEFGNTYAGLAVHDDQWYPRLTLPTTSHRRPRAMWAWSTANVNNMTTQTRLINFMVSRNVTIIYQDSEAFVTSSSGRARLTTFINNCWARGISVELLFGNHQWTYTQNHDDAVYLAQQAVNYFDTFTARSTTARSTTARSTTARSTTARSTTARATTAMATTARTTTARATTARATTGNSVMATTGVSTTGTEGIEAPIAAGGLIGVQVDADIAAFAGGVAANAALYLNALRSLRNATSGFELSVAIPRGYATQLYQARPLSELIADIADEIVVKVNSDVTANIVSRATGFFNYARNHTKRVAVGVETGCLIAGGVTFCEEGEGRLETNLQDSRSSFSTNFPTAFSGIVVNDYSTYFTMAINGNTNPSGCRSMWVRSGVFPLTADSQRTLVEFAQLKQVCKIYVKIDDLLAPATNLSELKHFVSYVGGNGIDISLMVTGSTINSLTNSMNLLGTNFASFRFAVGFTEDQQTETKSTSTAVIIGTTTAGVVVAGAGIAAAFIIYRRRRRLQQGNAESEVQAQVQAQAPYNVEITTGAAEEYEMK